MKRTRVFEYEVLGSTVAWPCVMDLSQNERSGTWTLYFRCVDPDASPITEIEKAKNVEQFLSILEEQSVDPTEFWTGLANSEHTKLVELASQIQDTLANQMHGDR